MLKCVTKQYSYVLSFRKQHSNTIIFAAHLPYVSKIVLVLHMAITLLREWRSNTKNGCVGGYCRGHSKMQA